MMPLLNPTKLRNQQRVKTPRNWYSQRQLLMKPATAVKGCLVHFNGNSAHAAARFAIGAINAIFVHVCSSPLIFFSLGSACSVD